jgi:hypothetical protein
VAFHIQVFALVIREQARSLTLLEPQKMAMEINPELVPGGNHPEMNSAPLYAPPQRVTEGAAISSMEQYKKLHARSLKDPEGFWGEQARKHLSWFRDFKEV